jgi:hypothetical protein
LLFAVVRNGSNYFGGVVNTTISYGSSDISLNISLYGMLGIPSNISMDNAGNFASPFNVSVLKYRFNLINSSNKYLSSVSAHNEITVDYTKFGAGKFTWLEDVPQSVNASFLIPLLNVTGVEEINSYVGGGNYAPKRVAPSLGELISANTVQNATNITISSFNPQAIDSIFQIQHVTFLLLIPLVLLEVQLVCLILIPWGR